MSGTQVAASDPATVRGTAADGLVVADGSAADGPATGTIGVAIAIPEPFGGELQTWRKEFGDPLADAIPTHVTLLPPTSVAADALDAVEDHLRGVAAGFEPFEIELRGSATFRPVSPVVFVSLSRGIAESTLLEAGVRSGPLARELQYAYYPHVTVAHDVPDEALDRAYGALASYEARFPVWGFSLYEHGSDGVWRPQRDYLLGRREYVPGPGPQQAPATS